MIKITLLIVRLLRLPIEWIGVDFHQFEIILKTKLTIDFRRSPTAFQTSGSQNRSFGTQFFFYAVYGILMAAIIYSLKDLFLSLSVFFSVLMVLLTMILISEFTTVLFDHRDNQILLPRPVDNRTMLFSRLVHIQFYIGYIALAVSITPALVIAIKFSVVALLMFLLAVGLSTWLILLLTSFIYLLISRLIEKEKFKDFISYLQIILGILLFAGYQLLPRVMDSNLLNNAALPVHWWTFLFPPAWLAALVKISLLTELTQNQLILSLLGVVFSVSGAVFLIKIMSKGFLNILGEGSSESVKQVKPEALRKTKSNFVRQLVCSSDIEKAGWDLTLATTRRDRKFKQSVYPYFGFMLVLVILILKPDFKNLSVSLHEISGFSRFFLITILGYCGSIAVAQLPFTDTPEAAWIYKALPLKETGHLLAGAVKAMLHKFLTPVYLIMIIPAIWLWGFIIIPQIILAALGNILLILLPLLVQKTELPFTLVREMQRKGMNSVTAFLSMILVGVLAGLLYLTSTFSSWITLIICLLFMTGVILLFRVVRNRKYI
jgi:ABC-2 type transport system permease protein